MAPERPRRIVKYPTHVHPGDIVLTPAWLQWLRHTREEGPSVQEQQVEVQRQENVKVLAQKADERWREQESFLDKPQDTAQELPLPTKPRDKGGYSAPEGSTPAPGGVQNMAGTQGEVTETTKPQQDPKVDQQNKKKEKSPWETHRGAPSEGWQPAAWSPGKAARR